MYRPWAFTVMAVDGLGNVVWWLFQVPGLFCGVVGVSLGPIGTMAAPVAFRSTARSGPRDNNVTAEPVSPTFG